MNKDIINKLSEESMIALTDKETEELNKALNDFEKEVLELYSVDTKGFISNYENV